MKDDIINDIIGVVLKTQEEFVEQAIYNANHPPTTRPEPKYGIGNHVKVNGWGSSATGTIQGIDWIFHNRLGEYTWGYSVEFDEGQRNPLAFYFIP